MPLLQVSPAGQGDDKATFLAEFRALRERAALEYDELAARAHYPTDVMRAAEAGPGLPGLPVLAAYVRACGGDVAEWEERWRRLESPVSGTSGLPMRPAGATPAAVAGARASVSVTAADTHDPERIRAALRADQEREEQASRSLTRADRRLSAAAADPLRTATGPATMIANGSHHKKPWPDGFDAASGRTGFDAASGGTEGPVGAAASAAYAGPTAEPVTPAPADEEFDAFRASGRRHASSTTQSWQAFDPPEAPAPRADTAAGSVWSTSANEQSAWSPSAPSVPSVPPVPSVSSVSEPPTRETAGWPGAFDTEPAYDMGSDFSRPAGDFDRPGSDFSRLGDGFGGPAADLSRPASDFTRGDAAFSSPDAAIGLPDTAFTRSDAALGRSGANAAGMGSEAPHLEPKSPRAAQPARPNAQPSTEKRSNHPVLLAVLVVLVLIGCIAVLVFT